MRMSFIEFNLCNGVMSRDDFPPERTVHFHFPADTAVHMIRSVDSLMSQIPEPTLQFTTDKDYTFLVRSKSYAFVTKGRLTADGIVQGVIFGAYLPNDQATIFYEWAVTNLAVLRSNFEFLT
jgi:hypothetical protein